MSTKDESFPAQGQSESGFFADYHSVRVAVGDIKQVDGLRPEDTRRWQEMDETKRLAGLQEVENRLAAAQGRPAQTVYGKRMNPGDYGYFLAQPDQDGRPAGIYVNTHPAVFNDRSEALNTVVHEGRHAYQDHATRNPGFHPQLETGHPQAEAHRDPSQWRQNDRNYVHLESGLEGKEKLENENRYMRQAMERDAGAFGFAVTRGVNPEYEPSQDRINKYNAENADQKYGFLFDKDARRQEYERACEGRHSKIAREESREEPNRSSRQR